MKWSGICPVCEAGRLFVRKRVDNGELCVLCEECFSLFPKPDDVADSALDEDAIETTWASDADLKAAGWDDLYKFEEGSGPF